MRASRLSISHRNCASTACAVAVATAIEWGCTVRISPVRSITPITSPVSGSWTGAAAQVQRWTISLKCSEANTWTACLAAIAVPIALVPAPPSDHSVPSAKFIESAARSRTVALPSTHSSTPLASETTIRCWDSSAVAARHERISGAISASGWISQRAEASSASATCGAIRRPLGSTPAAAERRQESAIGPRTGVSRESPSPLREPTTNRSQARRSSLALVTGAVATSMASQGLVIAAPSVPIVPTAQTCSAGGC